jgi:hypothetical protein
MKNDNEGVGAPSGPRLLASRSLWPECYRGDLANSKILGRDVAVWNFAPEELRGLDRDGFDVAIGPRLAVDRDSRSARRSPLKALDLKLQALPEMTAVPLAPSCFAILLPQDRSGAACH